MRVNVKLILSIIFVAIVIALGVWLRMVIINYLVENSGEVKELRQDLKKEKQKLFKADSTATKRLRDLDSLSKVSESQTNRIIALESLTERQEEKIKTYVKYNRVCFDWITERKGLKKIRRKIEVPCTE